MNPYLLGGVGFTTMFVLFIMSTEFGGTTEQLRVGTSERSRKKNIREFRDAVLHPVEHFDHKYPGDAVVPPIHNMFARNTFNKFNKGGIRDNIWFLSVKNILDVIKGKIGSKQMSNYILNAGCSASEADELQDLTFPLLKAGYKSLNFDGPHWKDRLTKVYAPFDVELEFGWLEPGKVTKLMEKHEVPKNIDLIKIDIDSFDCQLMTEILDAGYSPKAINIELNTAFPPPIAHAMWWAPPNQDGVADDRPANIVGNAGGDVALETSWLHGCSLQYATDILERRGYRLLQYMFTDGYFVREDMYEFFIEGGTIPTTPEDAYRIGNPNFYGKMPTENQMRWLGAKNKAETVNDVWRVIREHVSEKHLEKLPFTIYIP